MEGSIQTEQDFIDTVKCDIKNKNEVGRSFVAPTEGIPILIDEPSDVEGSLLADYKAIEIARINEMLTDRRVVHIDAESGSGMSEFVLPAVKYSYLEGSGQLPRPEDIKKLIKSKRRINTFVLDELGWNYNFINEPDKFADEVKQLMDQFPDLKFVFAVGRNEKTNNSLDILFEKIEQPVSVIKIGRKPFSESQARDYIIKRCPAILDLPNDQLKDDLFRYVIDARSQYGDVFHFRWIRKMVDNIKSGIYYVREHKPGVKYSEEEQAKIINALKYWGVLDTES